ncbi:MAG TPA: DNA methyltransferase [Ktedonobacterales bacterium]|jgi:DNA modification methylase
MKSWFSIDGALEPIEYDGPSFFRFPLELAELVISRYSMPGDWVFDPFCGFGTTLVAAQRLGRQAIGVEKDAGRASFAARRIEPPSRVINENIKRLRSHNLPPFNLLFTSPPYGSFRNPEWATDAHYFADLRAIFSKIALGMQPNAKLIIEISNLRVNGRMRPLAWDAARILSELFLFEGEMVRCNTGPQEAGPGYHHSYLLIFTNKG